ncbi:3'(2'),5'-bisphosphate nucleotidase CysQ family protein [Tanticharoenia sakaeratensis]|uniref:3'(2'),5'-bisphosphate nucleotidase CysQ n=1 Tax=Tanticharoenia sakaeratensis NBRC 103193 TaxID=1231623 RepID=A0A0D6MJN1_9PROT|nr:3'(2'),5'-bisphosphate nucleotidase CysQ [Tanticharoenia sakaeratensis]GAN53691.1 inositol monophosphatase [Tanticharoenia sakaeratensis NBRC 103193]GBQ17175.1 exopolysaccharide production protein [Tanticharoenia sakaeratensis NBRC 103193]
MTEARLSPHPDDASLLSLATTVAQEAAAIVNTIRARGFETEIKADRSPVTEADHAAEAHILQRLRAARPDIPAIGEEEFAAGVTMAPGDMFWLVDPLDGTREFAAGRDDFTVNIGLVRGDRAVLGAVALPAYGQTYYGGAGLGAFRIDADGTHAIEACVPPADGARVLASRHYADDPQLAAWIGARRIAWTRNLGSSVKFVRVAEGAADLYPRLGTTMEWDTAAPQAVVEAAGGRIVTDDGQDLRYGKTGWRNPHFLCMGRSDGAGS